MTDLRKAAADLCDADEALDGRDIGEWAEGIIPRIQALRAALAAPEVFPVLVGDDGKPLPFASAEAIHQAAEAAECVAMALDDAGVPRVDAVEGDGYSLWGRVQRYAEMKAAAPVAGVTVEEVARMVCCPEGCRPEAAGQPCVARETWFPHRPPAIATALMPLFDRVRAAGMAEERERAAGVAQEWANQAKQESIVANRKNDIDTELREATTALMFEKLAAAIHALKEPK